MPWVKDIPAILHISYLGTMGGASVADAISGKVNPSGKLPVFHSCPPDRQRSHVVWGGIISRIEMGGGDTRQGWGNNPVQKYKEDILVGYRWHDTKKIPALFPSATA